MPKPDRRPALPAKADVASAQAKFKATRVEQGRTALYAPFDGIVAKIVGELGDIPPIAARRTDTADHRPHRRHLRFASPAPLDEGRCAQDLKPGQPVRISLDAFPAPGKGTAPYVSAVESRRARSISRWISRAPGSARQTAGRLQRADRDPCLRSAGRAPFPAAALLEGNRVLVYSRNGRLDERTVRPASPIGNFPDRRRRARRSHRHLPGKRRQGRRPVVPDDKVKAGKWAMPSSS